MRKSGIYKITNPKGKVYIGQSVDLERRLQQYRGVCVTISGQPNIWESLNQYGSETHQYKIIEYCSLKNLDSREAYYKQQFINKNGWDKALFCWINDPPTSEEKRLYFKIKQRKPKIDKRLYDGENIHQYNMDGEYIREWTYKELKAIDSMKASVIKQHIDLNTPSCYSFIWRSYKELKIEAYSSKNRKHNPYNSKWKYLFA